MNKNKIVTIGLTLALTLGAVGCSKNNKTEEVPKNTTQKENTTANNGYLDIYSKNYNDYLIALDDYSMYNNVESVNKAYENKEYPGNEKYVSDLKEAYKDSKVKIQSFVDSLEKDAKTDDKDIKKMNDDLIAQGKKLISNLDEKIKKLDEIPKDAMTKSKDEFIKVVNDTTKLENEASTDFNKMIKDMNKKLGIDTKNTNDTKK